jgi:hypothetical protein
MASTTPGLDRATRLALGQIGGVAGFAVFADRFDLTNMAESTVWDGPEDIYTFTDPSINRINRISSSSALDIGQIRIVGLDENWIESVQTRTLDGQNKVVLSPELIRLNFAEAIGTDLVGDVSIYEDTPVVGGVPTDSTKVKGFIDPSNNTTRQAVFSVPFGKKAVFRGAFYGAIPSVQCCLQITTFSRAYNDALKRRQRTPFVFGGTTAFQVIAQTEFSLDSKTDTYVNVYASAPNAAITLEGDWELVSI